MMKNIVAALSLFLGLVAAAYGQPAPTTGNQNLGALITNTAQSTASVSSNAQVNATQSGAICTFDQTAETGSATTTIAIQFQDTVSGTWQSLATSGSIVALNTPTSVMVYPGAVATSVPSGMVIAGLKLPRIWRVLQTIVGGGSTTGTVGCDLLQ